MILVQRIDLAQRVAEITSTNTANPVNEVEPRFIKAALAAEIRELHVRAPDGSVQVHEISPDHKLIVPPPDSSNPSPVAETTAASRCLLAHRCNVDDSSPVYDSCFQHATDSLPVIFAYNWLLLATHPRENSLLQLRLALYEVCANIVDHGEPKSNAATIALHLCFGAKHVEGWVQDQCALFRPSLERAASLSEQAAARSRRGYGIGMMYQLLDNLNHEFNEFGNRIHFNKRIDP